MAGTFRDVSVVIPAFNPDSTVIELAERLMTLGFKDIIVINDGSTKQHNDIFDKLSGFSACTVLTHSENLGKGRALKTAFSFYKDNYPNGLGMVTADADGQHAPKDIKRIADELAKHPSRLILGVRDFSGEKIPLRSRFGNVLTKMVVTMAAGMKIADTQTGLRGISRSFAEKLLDIKGDRYEFEMKMILACRTHDVPISQVAIDTIYINDNESSHFHPILDSIKIYYVFLRFLFSSLASFVVDVLLFAVFVLMLKPLLPMSYIIVATVLARVLSSLFNYIINRNIVFKSYQYTKRTLIKYYVLAAAQMSASAGGVYVLYHSLGGPEVLIKIAVDSLLFLFSFYMQRQWVFRKG
ncbi:Glycosyltransferase involved in cell wall bisynthesis [Alteribacillus persepolensis]|uniref:Glycosyltransferase involved in cell wall bisynthesis n=1 Tax=Alteribacillus persepolensis TaxID=568899 RepID=A0A1G8AC39_9BACI|nr:bifunctional glycosyltransferase family 2/GtrA family protein [Alteribacillus persepolensis]SDH18461.1 Glycosyltransferase involved in cell wall bisynthesis [Alteribacillus persepolensis]